MKKMMGNMGGGMPKMDKGMDKHAKEHAKGMGEHSKTWDEATCRREMGKVMGSMGGGKKGKMGGM